MPDKSVPRWLIPLFSFIAGVAITAAVLMPSVATEDYQRGHAAGYSAGYGDGFVSMRAICENEKLQSND